MTEHLPAHRLAAAEVSQEEATHLASCGRCRVESRRLRAFLDGYDGAHEDALAPAEERYEDLGLVSTGGMGEVRRVRDRQLDRVLAMKLVRPAEGSGLSLASEASPPDEVVARFLREAHVTARLQHPSIVPIHEIGRRPDGALYYTMKLVPGRTLGAALAGCRTAADRLDLLSAFGAICHAVGFAHAQGVVHRDLKPANAMVGEFGDTVVIDWGLAKIAGESDQVFRAPIGSAEGTRQGTVLGTPGYMSPEQARGRPADARSDVWALGAILFEILVGRPPFEGPARELVRRAATVPVPPVRSLAPDAPVDLAAVADKALSFGAPDRYRDGRELAREIDAWRSGGRVAAHRYTSAELLGRFIGQNRVPVAVGTAALILLLAGGTASYAAVRRDRDAALKAEADKASALVDARARGLWAEAGRKESSGAPEEAVALVRAAARLDRGANPFATALILERLERKGGFERVLDDGNTWGASAAASPDGRTLAIGRIDGVALLYDADTGRILQRLPCGAGWVWGVAFSPDGRLLATGGEDRMVRVWDTATGALLTSFAGHERLIFEVRFSPDGRWLASTADDGTVRLWDVAGGAPAGTAVASLPRDMAVGIAFTPDGRLLSGSHGGAGLLWAVPGLAPAGTLSGHRARVQSVASSADGRWLATGDEAGEVRLFTPDGRLAHRAEVATDRVKSLAFSPDGRLLAWISKNQGFGTIDVATGEVVPFDHAGGTRIGFVPGKPWIYAYADGRTAIWDTASLTPLAAVGRGAQGLDFSPDGGWLALAGAPAPTSVVAPWVEPPPVPLGPASARWSRAAWSPDGRFVAGGGGTGAVGLWDAATGERVLAPRRAHDHYVSAISWLPDASAFATVSFDRTLAAWQPGRAEPLWIHDWGQSSRGLGMAVASPDSGRWVAGGDDPGALVLDARDGRVVAELTTDASNTVSADWSPDGAWLAAGTDAGAVSLWRTSSWTRATSFAGDRRVEWVRFRPDGRQVLAGTASGIRAWDLASGGEVELPAALAASHAIAFAGSRAASAVGAVVTVWDPSDWRVVRTLAPASDPPVDVRGISGDGRLVVAEGPRGIISWNLTDGAIVRVSPLPDPAVSPTDGRVVTRSEDGSLRLVDLSVPLDPAALDAAAGADNNFRVCEADFRVVPVPAAAADAVWAPAESCP